MFRYVLLAVVMLTGATAAAEDFSYSYVQGSYSRVEVDGGIVDADGDGFGFDVSVDVGDPWYVFGGYSTSDFDFGVDVDQLSLGVGWHRGLTEKTDFFATLAYVRAEIDVPAGFSVDDDGIGATVGVRSMVGEKIELYGSVNHVELDDAGGSTAIGGGFWYTMSGNLLLGLSVSFDDDVTTYGVGLRLYFDR